MRTFALLLLTLATACSPKRGTTVTDEPKPHSKKGPAAEPKRIRLEGKAVNMKLGPGVETPDHVLHCENLPHWPDDVLGTQVVVEGTLVTSDRFQATRDPETGAISQGTEGAISYLENCTVVR